MVIKQILLSIMSSLKMHSSDYCDLETVAGYETLVFKDNTMLSILRYNGLLSQVSGNNFDRMINQMALQLNNLMLNSGYKIICVFRKDLDAFSSLARIEATKKKTARQVHLDFDDIIEESVDNARANVYDEDVYFGLMTNMKALDPLEAEAIIKRKPNKDQDIPKLTSAQNIFHTVDVLHAKHNEFVERFMGSLRGGDFYVSIEKLNIIKSLALIRHHAQPNSSPRDWIPTIAINEAFLRDQGIDNYKAPVNFPSNSDLEDMSYLMPQELSRQVLSQNIEVLGAAENLPPNTIRADGRLYASVFMDIPPTSPAMFNDIFSAFNNTSFYDSRGRIRTMPWSLTFQITGDGLAGSMMKKVFKDVTGLAPPMTNANLQAAYNQLEWLKQNDKAVVGVQVSAMTWVDDINAHSREVISNRKNRLKYSMESWGGMKVIDNVGDPIIGWRSNLLGMSTGHVGTKGAAPLNQVLAMLPLTRPASAFKKGTVINRTLDGKLMLLEKFSSLMRTWVKCIVGTPGSGKSVMLNNDLVETCLLSGMDRLPLITVIDKGESSSGFIELIKDRLPPHLHYLAVTKKLRKDKEYAINPFDTKVGTTYPLNSEKTQMEAFLVALMTPAESSKPYKGTLSFVSQLIDSLFDSIQEGTETGVPNKYQFSQNAELDEFVIEHNIVGFEKDAQDNPIWHRPDEITYFAMVRKLHVLGESFRAGSKKRSQAWRARDLSHRLAMPTMVGLNAILSSSKIIEAYTNEVESGETMPVYAKRAVSEALAAYPCFSHHTQFDVDTARVVSLDLQEVVSKQNPKQSSLFVQIARMVGVRKINLSKEDVASPAIPKIFKAYYETELANLNGDKKVLAIDEMHNYRGNTTFMGLLEVDAREGRKWGLELILASQNISDFYFPDTTDGTPKVDLLGFVTHLCVCTTPEGDDLTTFRKYFDPANSNTGKHKIPASTLESIRLDASGLTYLSCLTTKKEKYTQLLTLQVGAKLLWSLTTTAEDRQLRNAMYKRTSGDRTKAIAALAYYLPSGAKDRVEKLRSSLLADDSKMSEEELARQSNSLIEDLSAQAFIIYEQKLAKQREIVEDY